jgi:outer membrane PBP1 activator LpoA protein
MPDHAAAKASQQIALLLPLSGRLTEAGETVRDGFMAAHLAQKTNGRPSVRIYDTANDAGSTFRKAIDEGATFIVGPLGKESVAAVRAHADGKTPVLALNHLADGETVPKRFYQFALAPEDEARQIANYALQRGQKTGALLVPAGEWGARVRQAFSTAFAAGGGHLASAETYPTDTTDFSDILTPLLGFEESQKRYRTVSNLIGGNLVFTPRRRDDLEFIFFAGQPVHARLVRPQLKFHYAGDLPLYATSDIHDPRAASNQDLEGVSFLEIPWLISDDESTAALRETVRQLSASDSRRNGRLFALGYDARKLVDLLRDGDFGETLNGLTGLLSLTPEKRIRRTLQWASFGSDGIAHPQNQAN